jgi:hypothetical protein
VLEIVKREAIGGSTFACYRLIYLIGVGMVLGVILSGYLDIVLASIK